MPSAESAARGRTLLAERVRFAPEAVAAVPDRIERLLEEPVGLPRMLVATGIGTSEGHARHLAELAPRVFGQPARFASTGSLAATPPPGSEADWLVVFSQGLSANARHALRHPEAWGGVVLVTGLPGPGEARFAELASDKQAWLETLARAGVVQIDMGCGTEYGALLRVVGARVGYAVVWSLLRSLAARRLVSDEALRIDRETLRAAQQRAADSLHAAFPASERVAAFFAAERSLILVSDAGRLELCEQLTLKIAEGMLRPQPRAVDVLHFAHGPLQSLALRPASILYLAGPPLSGPVVAGAEADRAGVDWLARFERTLDPDLHDLRVLRAELPLPFSVLEHEAMLDALVLRQLEETGLDLVDWPGREREDALYAEGPAPPRIEAGRVASSRRSIPLEERVYPEVEVDLASGRRSALVALGSIEQHGPHLPLGTDRWIADALAAALADRVADAVALPALAVGCAREHLDFAGTLHLSPETLESVLRDLIASLAHHGFERVFVFTAHGGNVDALDAMRERLASSAAPMHLHVETDLSAVARLQADVVGEAGLDPLGAGPHAGEFETSVVAALRAGAVRSAALEVGPLIEPEQAQKLFYPSLREHTPTGVLGDPSRSSSARGAGYLAAWVDHLERVYRSVFPDRPEKKSQ